MVMHDKGVDVYNMADATVVHSLEHDKRLLGMAYYRLSEDKEYVFTGGEDKHLRVWDAITGTLLHTVHDAHDTRYITFIIIQACSIKDMTCLHVNAPSLVHLLATISTDGVVQCWDMDKVLAGGDKQAMVGTWSANCRLTCVRAATMSTPSTKRERTDDTEAPKKRSHKKK
jgi:WD40 repeat protein